MNNISGFNTQINIIASRTFPVALLINQFADDSDPIDVPSLQIADSAMGLNGDLLIWSKPNPIKVTLNVIPDSFTDKNLAILLEANRVGRGKTGAMDNITLNILYPNGLFTSLFNGAITDGIPFNRVQSAGRLGTKSYAFTFENKIGI